MFRSILTAMALTLAAPVSAQDLLASYFTMINGPDLYNSKGAPLSSLPQYIQQDRANFHRFGKAQPGDEWDPFFGDRALRAQIPALYARGGGSREMETQLRRYGSAFVLVRIFGYGNRPDYIIVSQGAG